MEKKSETAYINYETNSEDLNSNSTSRDQSLLQKVDDFVTIEGTEGLSLSQLFLYNYDLRPVEEARRTWSWYNYVFFWIADSFNVNTWQIAATGVQAGLSWWVTWITVILGYTLCGLFVTQSARVGNAYHISFPVSCRSSFGIWGLYGPLSTVLLWQLFGLVFRVLLVVIVWN